MTMMLMMTMIGSLLFLFMKHPLTMGMMLLIQTTLISMITGTMSHNFWYSYILFLIMIGGMLVLFIYMTSIASNEMFKYSNKLIYMMSLMFIFNLMFMIIDPQLFKILMFNTDMLSSELFSQFKFSLNKYLNFPSILVLMFLIIYLFITLIAIVKITNVKYGPLRKI